MKNKNKIAYSVAGLILLIAVTVGVTYAIFNYGKEGTTENIVTTGNLKFLYTEVSGIGNGISITDALPVSDEEGKSQTGVGRVFDFKVEANTPGAASIPYEITAFKTTDSTLEEDVVKVYLTEVNGSMETAMPLTYDGTKVLKYNELANTTISGGKGKTIYNGTVPKNMNNYLKTFRVRMWIDGGADFASGNYNGKTFTIKVNVYAKAKNESAIETVATIPNDSCFDVSETFITNYYEYENNDPSQPTCPKKIIIPSTVKGTKITAIGSQSFFEKNLASVEIPEGVESIGATAFAKNKLVSVHLPSTLKSIQKYAFQNNQITSLEIPEGVTEIEAQAFQKNKITNLVIATSVTVLDGAFNNNLLPDDQAFIYARNSDGSEDKSILASYGGSKRKNVVIPSNVTTLQNSAFSDTELESVVIPEGITEISYYAFNNNKLTSISFPTTVTTIGSNAFSNNQLTNLEIPNTITRIGTAAFSHNKITNLVLPDNGVKIDSSAFNDNLLPDDQAFIYEVNSNKTQIISYGGAKKENVIIPSSVTLIKTSAFSSSSIVSVTIPATVKEIYGYAFSGNVLKSVKIIGKSNQSEFESYGPGIWEWAPGYSDANIEWNAPL